MSQHCSVPRSLYWSLQAGCHGDSGVHVQGKPPFTLACWPHSPGVENETENRKWSVRYGFWNTSSLLLLPQLQDICGGMAYLHSLPMLHQMLTPRNILVSVGMVTTGPYMGMITRPYMGMIIIRPYMGMIMITRPYMGTYAYVLHGLWPGLIWAWITTSKSYQNGIPWAMLHEYLMWCHVCVCQCVCEHYSNLHLSACSFILH